MNPQFLRSVITTLIPSSTPSSKIPPGTARLTIFYNGTVVVFGVHHDKVEMVIRMAAGRMREFALYVSSISNELRVPVRYMRKDKPRGSAGGFYSFRDYIILIILLNCDVCCSFPLPELLEAY